MPTSSNWSSCSKEAQSLLSRGHTDEAIKLFRDIANANGQIPDVHNNLAVALRSVGRLEEALASYKVTLVLNPDHRVARINLARAFRQLGRGNDALRSLIWAVRINKENRDALSEMELNIRTMRFEGPSELAKNALGYLFADQERNPQHLLPPVARLLFADREIRAVLERAEQLYPDRDPASDLAPWPIANPLLIALLLWTIAAVPEIEKWITVVRRSLLHRSVAGLEIKTDPSLLWAIAAQCDATDHAQMVTSDELDLADELIAQLQQGGVA